MIGTGRPLLKWEDTVKGEQNDGKNGRCKMKGVDGSKWSFKEHASGTNRYIDT